MVNTSNLRQISHLFPNADDIILAAADEIDELRNAFVAYADHKKDCSSGDGVRCACGYLDAYMEIDAQRRFQYLSADPRISLVAPLKVDLRTTRAVTGERVRTQGESKDD